MSRLIIVSNRLPVTVTLDGGELLVKESTGGLATGLATVHGANDSLWIGWPGESKRLSRAAARQLKEEFERRKLQGVDLTAQEVKDFYHGFSNGVLWPLFHYLVDQMPSELSGWDAYRTTNERFADIVANAYHPGDMIWVHDYQLMLLPGMLRERLPDATIGFFLHIPFPSSEVFRILPWRQEILRGMLGADLIGFHTFSYARHFSSCLLRVLGIETQLDQVDYEGRPILVQAFPMGIDWRFFEACSNEPQVVKTARDTRRSVGDRKVFLAVDRLDYTKGIPRRLLAFERLLERAPELRGKVTLIQIAVPSRMHVPAYERLKRIVDELVGRINGRFATPGYQPVQYLFKSFSQHDLVAFYRAADVMLVTPLRDGMNLVAKEFIGCRTDEQGVLVLSEFAGASSELAEALMVNPYDLDQTAEVMQAAALMDAGEASWRMRSLRQRIRSWDNAEWAATFIDHARELRRKAEGRVGPQGVRPDALVKSIDPERKLALFLDYDGTLVPIVKLPGLAGPDSELLRLMKSLAATPNIELHVVSGRSREVLSDWLGALPLHLHAEHGFWSSPPPLAARQWFAALPESELEWKERLRPVLDQFTRETPGSLLEEKTCGFAWHYRMVEPELAFQRANELRFQMRDAIANLPLEMIHGKKVIELRHKAVSKGSIILRHQHDLGEGPLLVAIGDDQTDEDMFHALPESSLSISVNNPRSSATYRLQGYKDVREFLELVVRTRPMPAPGAEAYGRASLSPPEALLARHEP